jgi:hypothetical protein
MLVSASRTISSRRWREAKFGRMPESVPYLRGPRKFAQEKDGLRAQLAQFSCSLR